MIELREYNLSGFDFMRIRARLVFILVLAYAGQAAAQEATAVQDNEPPAVVTTEAEPPAAKVPAAGPPKGLDGLKRTIAMVEKDIAKIDKDVREMSRDMEAGDQVLAKWNGTSASFLAFSRSASEAITACSLIDEKYKDGKEQGEHEIVLKHMAVQLADCKKVIRDKNQAIYQYKNKLDEVSEQIDKVKNMITKVGEFKDAALKNKKSLDDEKVLIDKLSGSEAATKALQQNSVPMN